MPLPLSFCHSFGDSHWTWCIFFSVMFFQFVEHLWPLSLLLHWFGEFSAFISFIVCSSVPFPPSSKNSRCMCLCFTVTAQLTSAVKKVLPFLFSFWVTPNALPLFTVSGGSVSSVTISFNLLRWVFLQPCMDSSLRGSNSFLTEHCFNNSPWASPGVQCFFSPQCSSLRTLLSLENRISQPVTKVLKLQVE